MLKRQLGALFLVACLILTTVPAVMGGSNSKVITVAGNGKGDFNCDGKDDHVQINQALALAAKNSGYTVRLVGPFTYSIGDSLKIGSNTVLEGTSGAVIKLKKGLTPWGSSQKGMLMISGNKASNVVIRSLTVDGSQSDCYSSVRLGANHFNMATLIGCTGLTIKNVTFRNGCNDAMRISKCKNVLIDGVTVSRCGHDGICAFDVVGITVKNCKFYNRTNSSTRFDYVTNGVFANNECTSSAGGYAGLELEDTLKNISVYGNYFHDLPAPAIVRVHTTESNVKIYNNKIVNCG